MRFVLQSTSSLLRLQPNPKVMKLKIQMRMLGAVVVLYTMLIISGLLSPKNHKSHLEYNKESITYYQKIDYLVA